MVPICTFFIFMVTLFLLYSNTFLVQGMHPEVLLNFEQRVKLHGYPVEIHPIVTEDGYILTLYRIPHGIEKARDEPKNKSAILIVHGMGGSAMNFITLGAKISPAYYFADRGFDVWMICSRGVDCQNPKKHKRYDWNRDEKYWHYSFHETGLYDVSAAIDHIISLTGQQQIFAIGHSVGAPELYVLVIERPEYNDKIKIITNYAGATSIKHLDYPLGRVVFGLLVYFRTLISKLGLYELLPPNAHAVIISLTRVMCADPEFKNICYRLVPGMLANAKSDLIDEDVVEIIFSNFPRLSTQQVIHFGSNLVTGDFRKYDWGPRKNMKIYGQKTPPHYNMIACTCASAFFYGRTDSLSTPQDNWDVMDKLPTTILDYEIGPKFNHLDFLFAKNATFMVYEPTVQLFTDYDQGRIPPKILRKKKSTH